MHTSSLRPLVVERQNTIRRPVIGFCFVVFLILTTVLTMTKGHADANGDKIIAKSSGYCIDDRDSVTSPNAVVDVWRCNATNAQTWSYSDARITHDDNECLMVQNNQTSLGSMIVMNSCNDSPGQVWLPDGGAYENPNSGQCLATAGARSGGQLKTMSCSYKGGSEQQWVPETSAGKLVTANPACSTSEGSRVACYAEQQWGLWQTGSANHENLLNSYTDGAPYEEWCADFVSYVYKQAGYPFTQGESQGWDESNANNVQNMGFSLHMADSGYIPKPGDVAYFDYPGGHVEIVVSGGAHPTFIYGNSARIDPTTGNGQMEANTITEDGSDGTLVYYLTPIPTT